MERVTSVGVTAKHSFSSPARNLVVSKNALKNLSRCQTLCQLSEAGGGKHGKFNGFFYYCCCVCIQVCTWKRSLPLCYLGRGRAPRAYGSCSSASCSSTAFPRPWVKVDARLPADVIEEEEVGFFLPPKCPGDTRSFCFGVTSRAASVSPLAMGEISQQTPFRVALVNSRKQ